MYEITIKETREVRRVLPKHWEKVGSIEKERESRFFSDGKDAKTYIADEMGYTPEVETLVSETVVCLVQNVEKLDLASVIKAINGL